MPSELPGGARRRALLDYLTGPAQDGGDAASTVLPGARPGDRRPPNADRGAPRLPLGAARRASPSIAESGADTAFAIAQQLWSDEIAETQTVLAIWEVLGHLDILVNRGSRRRGCRRRTAITPSTRRRRSTLPQRDIETVNAPLQPYDRFDLTGRVALVTGGTRGLGRAIIHTLAHAGADIVVSSRKQDACDEAAEEVAQHRAARARARVPRRPLGRARGPRRRRVRGVRAPRHPRQQRRHRADLPRPAERHRGALGQDDRREPQGAVPADGARRRTDGRGRRRRRSSTSARSAASARRTTSFPTPPRRPG